MNVLDIQVREFFQNTLHLHGGIKERPIHLHGGTNVIIIIFFLVYFCTTIKRHFGPVFYESHASRLQINHKTYYIHLSYRATLLRETKGKLLVCLVQIKVMMHYYVVERRVLDTLRIEQYYTTYQYYSIMAFHACLCGNHQVTAKNAIKLQN